MSLRPRVLRTAPAAAVALAAAGLLAACGSDIDTGQMEEDIRSQMSEQAGVDAEQVSVDCPDGEEADEGNEFDCTLTAPNGDEVTVAVTITDGGDSFEAIVPPEQFQEQDGGNGGNGG